MKGYRTIEGISESEFEDRGSRFFGFATRVASDDAAVAFRHSIIERVPDASHYVSAWVLHEGGVEKYSDAKEPHGTAGLPVLNAIKGRELEDVVCVVARVFGGTLLGRGGLMRAYTTAASRALDAARIVERTVCRDVRVRIGYAQYEQLTRLLGDAGAQVLSTDWTSDVSVAFRLRSAEAEVVAEQVTELTNGTAEVVIGGEQLAFLSD